MAREGRGGSSRTKKGFGVRAFSHQKKKKVEVEGKEKKGEETPKHENQNPRDIGKKDTPAIRRGS